MEDVWMQIRREHGEYLTDTLQPEELAYRLFNKKLISSHMQEILMHPMTPRQQKNHELLVALQSTGQRGFDAFCEVLEERPSWSGVLERLTGRCVHVFATKENSCQISNAGSTVEASPRSRGNEEELPYLIRESGITSRGQELAKPSDGHVSQGIPKEHQEKISKSTVTPLSDQQINSIANRLAADWENLGYELKLPSYVMSEIRRGAGYPDGVDKAREMLFRAREANCSLSLEELVQALRSLRLNRTAGDVEKMIRPSTSGDSN